MSNPTVSSRHIDKPLTNMTIAAMQDDDRFLMTQLAPIMSVPRASDYYYIYSTGDWNRLEMRPRGPGEETHLAGWTLSSTTYNCKRESVGNTQDWFEEPNADEMVRKDRDVADWLKNQARLYGEGLVSTNAFTDGIWTTDWDGAAAENYAGKEILHWSDAASDPLKDHVHLMGLVDGLIFKEVNVMAAGYEVYQKLLTNATIRTAMAAGNQFTSLPNMRAKLAAYFGVEKFLVGAAVQNTAKEGQTASLSRILGTKDFWAGYVNPRVGLKSMTALRTFGYTADGRAPDGMSVRTWQEPGRTSDVSAVDCYWDVKVIAADAAYFVKGAVA